MTVRGAFRTAATLAQVANVHLIALAAALGDDLAVAFFTGAFLVVFVFYPVATFERLLAVARGYLAAAFGVLLVVSFGGLLAAGGFLVAGAYHGDEVVVRSAYEVLRELLGFSLAGSVTLGFIRWLLLPHGGLPRGRDERVPASPGDDFTAAVRDEYRRRRT